MSTHHGRKIVSGLAGPSAAQVTDRTGLARLGLPVHGKRGASGHALGRQTHPDVAVDQLHDGIWVADE